MIYIVCVKILHPFYLLDVITYMYVYGNLYSQTYGNYYMKHFFIPREKIFRDPLQCYQYHFKLKHK